MFNRIKKQMANLSLLELANVGPKLLSVSSLSLAVPGTYKAGVPITRIQSFAPQLTVLTSKQRPRKVNIRSKMRYVLNRNRLLLTVAMAKHTLSCLKVMKIYVKTSVSCNCLD